MPKLAAFPKAYLDELCINGKMSLKEWIELAATLDIDGLEFYTGIIDLKDPKKWGDYRKMVEDHKLEIPMMCCSPDFTHHDKAFRDKQIDLEKGWIDMCAEFGGSYCRVLSGQRRPEISREDGLRYTADAINACIPHATECGVKLILENHYKDNYWTYPEFAQYIDIFCDLVDLIDSPQFGVNYDPSNTLIAGENPLELLDRIKHRVVTMHASDRYVAEGTLEDLRKEENVEGYASRMRHGEIGEGLNDYDKIFATLHDVGFNGWVSIEDGVDGMDQMHRSVAFLRNKFAQYWS